jgi:hypothetical protein
MKIDTPLARLYNVAEYFFGKAATDTNSTTIQAVADDEYPAPLLYMQRNIRI